MTLADACARFFRTGPHAGRTLCQLALDEPHYLIAIVEAGGVSECRAGTVLYDAVAIVADRLIDNWAADILAGRTLGPDDFTRADEPIDGTFGPAGTERARADHARRGRAYPERPRDEPEPMALFKTLK